MSMKTRSQSITSSRGRVDYKKLIDDADDDEVTDKDAPQPPSKQRRSSNGPIITQAKPLLNTKVEEKEEAEAETEPAPVVNNVTDTSKIIDEFLKALRPDADEPQQPSQSQPPAPPVQQLRQERAESVNHSPTVPNHSYDTLPPPRPRPEISVSKDTKFPCTFSRYGCSSTFASKNEWKRHVAIQHVQLGFYRCDVGVCNPENRDPHSRDSGYNDFNRKDLFTMHQRRMHSPWGVTRQPNPEEKEIFESGLEKVRQRCWRAKRQPPLRTVCGFCGRLFEDKIPQLPPTMPAPAPAPLRYDPSPVQTLPADPAPDAQRLQNITDENAKKDAPTSDKGDPMDVDPKLEQLQNNGAAPAAAQSQIHSQAPSAPQGQYPAQPPNPAQQQFATPGQPPHHPPSQTPPQGPNPAQPQYILPPPPGMQPMPPQPIPVDAHGLPIVKDPTAWEDRMEHVGRHLAKEDAHLREEAEDVDLTAWGLREGLLKDCGPKGVWLIGMEPQGDSLDGLIRKRKKRIK